MINANEIIQQATDNGSIEIIPGRYFQTREDIQSDQTGWDERDASKNVNFGAAPYWITSDSGAAPMPIQDASELEAFLAEYR